MFGLLWGTFHLFPYAQSPDQGSRNEAWSFGQLLPILLLALPLLTLGEKCYGTYIFPSIVRYFYVREIVRRKPSILTLTETAISNPTDESPVSKEDNQTPRNKGAPMSNAADRSTSDNSNARKPTLALNCSDITLYESAQPPKDVDSGEISTLSTPSTANTSPLIFKLHTKSCYEFKCFRDLIALYFMFLLQIGSIALVYLFERFPIESGIFSLSAVVLEFLFLFLYSFFCTMKLEDLEPDSLSRDDWLGMRNKRRTFLLLSRYFILVLIVTTTFVILCAPLTFFRFSWG